MFRAVANDAGDAVCRTVLVDSRRFCQFSWGIFPYAGMIIVENKNRFIVRILLSTDAGISGAKVTIFGVFFFRLVRLGDGFPVPGAVLSMRGDDDPFFAQRMPAFFPNHKNLFEK